MMRWGKLLPEALRCLVSKPATVNYPEERMPVPPGFRGAPTVQEETCIGCKICARECPAGAITMVDIGEKMPRPAFHYDQCIYCAVCSDVCPKHSIILTERYELAATVRESMIRLPKPLIKVDTEEKKVG